MRALVAIAAAALALLAPTPALGAVASVSDGLLTVSAASGEVNRFSLWQSSDGDDDDDDDDYHGRDSALVVYDAADGARLSPGAGCSSSGRSSVRCVLPRSIVVDAGDADDSAVAYTSIPSALYGGAGADYLHGGFGDDVVDGGPGEDRLRGGRGNDRILSGDGARDEVECGDGQDSVDADDVDVAAPDCEVRTRFAPPAPAREPVRITRKPVPVSERGLARMRLRCALAGGRRCAGRVTLMLPQLRATAAGSRTRHVLGRARFRARGGRLAVVKVRLSRNGRRRVLRRRRIRCRVSVAVRRPGGGTTTVNGTVLLRRAGVAR